jgi:hypothetical protein
MQWKPYLMGLLLALVVGQVTLLVAPISGCPVVPCQSFLYCTSKAGDSQIFPCSYYGNQCTPPATWYYQYTSPWCCDAFIETTPACCQYDAEVFLCVETGRTAVRMIRGQYRSGQICDPYTGLCGYYA